MAGLGLTADDLHGVLLLRDCLEAQGSFLLAHVVKLALSGSARAPAAVLGEGAPPPLAAAVHARRVVLLAAQHAASHYHAVLRKVGLSVPSLLATKQLAVVDLLPSMGGGLPSLKSVHSQLAAAVRGCCGDGTDPDSGLHEGGGNASGLLLLCDDLSVLRCLAEEEQEWRAFLHGCCALGQAPGCCFAALAHADVAADEGWLARLEHAAALVLEVEPLEPGKPGGSGGGRVAVTRREPPPPGGGAAVSGKPGSWAVGYRLSDAGPTFLGQQQAANML